MNLLLEYLIRTDSLNKLINYPCELAGTVEGNKFLYVLEKSEDCICVYEWNFSIFNGLFPHCEKKYINDIQDHTFLHPKFEPISIIFNSTNTELNTYNHPMSKENYEKFTNNQLNNVENKKHKIDWLWECFLNYFNTINGCSSDYLIEDLQIHQHHIQKHYPEVWCIWEMWCNTFIPDKQENIACELLFLKK
jgi:hypothetical protein